MMTDPRLVSPQVKRATVIPPRQYKRRFRDALNRYFIASVQKYDTPANSANSAEIAEGGAAGARVGSGW